METTVDSVRQLFRIIDWIYQFVEADGNRKFLQELEAIEKETKVPYITSLVERLGLERGLAQGLAQGEVQGMLLAIERTLSKNFAKDGLDLMPEIRTRFRHGEAFCDF